MQQFLEESKQASKQIATLSGEQKNKILLEMAFALEENANYIIEENQKDISAGKESGLSDALMDRLFLDQSRVIAMAQAIKEIASQKDPVGRVLDGWVTQNGLNIQKVSIPIGVIGIIYESRPNVTSDTAALCFKSGNVCVLKGGKEAENSNIAITKVLQNVLLKHDISRQAIALLPYSNRESVSQLIKQDKLVDLIIPRGGEQLIRFVSENSSIPVVKHDKGICHTYIDENADARVAIDIAINAKCQRPGVCNSMETLLVHENIATIMLPALYEAFMQEGTKLKGCAETRKILFEEDLELATQEDFATEYLANILNIKVVKDVKNAVEHITQFGSGHSEAIISETYSTIEYFLNNVDAACVYANASTRFTDGGAFGMGAEVGISTNKLHARGPMGINDLTTYKFKILGNGQVR